MKTPKLLFALLAISFLGPTAFPCSPSFPRGYVWRDTGERILEIPRMNFYYELSKILEVPKPLPAKTGTLWSHTIQADVADLRSALTEAGWEPNRVQEAAAPYGAMRSAMKQHFDKSENDTRFGKRGTGPTRWVRPADRVPLEAPTPFDFAPYAELLGELPEEFALYVRGAVAYRLEEYEDAVAQWSQLLAIDAGERQFRSTWAAFMAGKAALHNNPTQAITFFEQTRELAEEGFRDTLDLAKASVGWQARAEMDAEDYLSSMSHYAIMVQSQDAKEQAMGRASLSRLCSRLFREDLITSEFVKDPLCRKALSTWAISHPKSNVRSSPQGEYKLVIWSARWLSLLSEGGFAETIPEAGLLACSAYRAGDMDIARLWLEQADEADLYAQWIQSKLLLRAGNTDEALAILSELKDAFPGPEAWNEIGRRFQTVPRDLVYGEVGVLDLSRQAYVSALDAFVRGRSRNDAIFVAERILTSGELESYVQQHAGDEALQPPPPRPGRLRTVSIDTLRYTLAKRLAREGDFESARKYYPEKLKLDATLNDFLQAYSKSVDTTLPPEVRGKYMFDAAQLKRKYGRDLFGTSHVPGWTAAYVRNPTARLGSDWASDDEKERVVAHAPVPNKPYHYVYRAADMMWEAAELLPDNDPLTARALWYGGKWLEKRANWEYLIGPNNRRRSKDPDAVQLDLLPADRFYKALVNRNRKLPYAQEADRLRWFPKQPPE